MFLKTVIVNIVHAWCFVGLVCVLLTKTNNPDFDGPVLTLLRSSVHWNYVLIIKCLLYVQIKTSGQPPHLPNPGRTNKDLSGSDLVKFFIYRIWNFSSLDLCPTDIGEKLYLKQCLNL